ncbi:uncharacterized protein FOMMEDRAFT_101108 [Fomitiporia mediterranea MF3/22]|uniref:uncharacterized protein n=1 Tax=Fomitiporia mediterranea (strain MF3/22) TaxID=694068 RepID=UPI00044089D6|nr:uncharacterized protein FOMMEDRAFT_101108 [Fomitiporia mediterranea MF3/22]EJD07710.1 hypothetical protein FOMMEDRAFT_101108 [Fomitiporia mediterranea MF3/22]
MDGFDDLLSSSSHAFGDNPFANPFEKPRSSSPDPWASFGQTQQTHEEYSAHFEEDRFEATSGGAEPLDITKAHEDEVKEHKDVQEEHDAGPLTIEEDVHDSTSLQSPGFRESIAVDDVPTPESPKSSASDAHSPVTEEPTTAAESSPRSRTPTIQSPPSASIADHSQENQSTPPIPPPLTNRFVSPLDYPSLEASHSFASLALGGESAGGWQDSEAEYSRSVTDTSEDVKQSPVETASSLNESTEDEPQVKKVLGSQRLFSIRVEDPQKVGDPIRPYILYTVHTETTSPLFTKPSFSVLRRYSDFLWLYETLSLNNPGVIVPPVPEKSSFGRFANLFVQQRRLALEICIRKIANHPVLAKDPDLKLFLESDNFALEIKHRKTEIAQERGGIMSSIGQTISGSRFVETDDWFERKKAYLDGLESQLRGLVKSIDSVSKQREDLAIATGEFAIAVRELSESDLSKQLCHSLSVLSEAERKAQDLQHVQAQEDTMTFMTTAEEYARVINSVRMAFNSRARCHSQWQHAESELRRVKQAHEKARSQGRIPQERMSHALAQVAEAERKALDAKHDFERCGKLLKVELGRFEEERIVDFKKAMEAFLEGMIQRQKEVSSGAESCIIHGTHTVNGVVNCCVGGVSRTSLKESQLEATCGKLSGDRWKCVMILPRK